MCGPKGPNGVDTFLPSPEDRKISSFRNAMFSRFQNTGRWTNSKNTVILGIIYHRQNHLESTC
jgi:hypothetical protein